MTVPVLVTGTSCVGIQQKLVIILVDGHDAVAFVAGCRGDNGIRHLGLYVAPLFSRQGVQ